MSVRTLLLATGCWITILAGPLFVSSVLLHGSEAQGFSTEAPASTQRALLDEYCVVCHNQRLRTGGLALDQMDLSNLGEGAAVWERVVEKLRIGSMPPMGRPRPDNASREALVRWLETGLDHAAAAHPEVGRPLLHRLNRSEYANALRDLLALDVDVSVLLPADDASHGFDNVADGLGVSPLLIDQYVTAARKISRLAVGDPASLPETKVYRTAPDLTQDEHLEGLPLGTRGGLTVQHTFPLNGDYELGLRLVRNFPGIIRGLAESQQIDVLLDGTVVQQFAVGGPDSYRVLDGGSKGFQAPTAALRADEPLHLRLHVAAGPHTIAVAFARKTHAQSEDLRQPPLRSFSDGVVGVGGVAHLESLSVSGPYDATAVGETPTRRRIFVCRPATRAEEASCAKAIVSAFARRAYRGRVSESSLRTLLTFYEMGRQEGATFEAGIQLALRRILASPQFMFRFEHDPENVRPGAIHPISDLELASRLSFFLWSSIPDDELLAVAEQGRLRDPAVLERQVRRMLADARARALVENFAGQWLNLRSLRNASPNQGLFPDFDDNLRRAFQQETELFVENIIREDRSVIDFLDANYTFVNERLARHYEIPQVYGSHFRRVTFSDDRRRGLLGQGSVLTVTSYDDRTAPTIRGKWLLESILGAPPPPPPPNVASLKDEEQATGDKVPTMRERMEQHRKNPACASCHAGMDPLGFALENFDAVGHWRGGVDRGASFDVSGSMPDGTTFKGVQGLRGALLTRREAFVSTLTRKLLTYALGQGVEYYDMPTVRRIVRQSAASDYRWSSVVLGVVNSAPFQKSRSAERPSTAAASSASASR